jgi:hypothetical protein
MVQKRQMQVAKSKANSNAKLFDRGIKVGGDNLQLPGQTQALKVLNTGLNFYAQQNVEPYDMGSASQNEWSYEITPSVELFSGALVEQSNDFGAHYEGIGTYGDDSQDNFENISIFKPVVKLKGSDSWYEQGFAGLNNESKLVGGVSIINGEHMEGNIDQYGANQLLAPDWKTFESGEKGVFVGKNNNGEFGYWYRHFDYEDGNVTEGSMKNPIITNLLSNPSVLNYQRGYKMNINPKMTQNDYTTQSSGYEMPLAFGGNMYSVVRASYDLDNNIKYDNILINGSETTIENGELARTLFDPNVDISGLKLNGNDFGADGAGNLYANRVYDDNNNIVSVSLRDDSNNYELIVQNYDVNGATDQINNLIFKRKGGENVISEYGQFLLADALGYELSEVEDDVTGGRFRSLNSKFPRRGEFTGEGGENAKNKWLQELSALEKEYKVEEGTLKQMFLKSLEPDENGKTYYTPFELNALMVNKELEKRRNNTTPEASIRRYSNSINSKSDKTNVEVRYQKIKNPVNETLNLYENDATVSSINNFQASGFLKIATKAKKPVQSFRDINGKVHSGLPDRVGKFKYTGGTTEVGYNGEKLIEGQDYYMIYLKEESFEPLGKVSGAGKVDITETGWIIVPDGMIESYLLDYFVLEGDGSRINEDIRKLTKNMPVSNTFTLNGTTIGSGDSDSEWDPNNY